MQTNSNKCVSLFFFILWLSERSFHCCTPETWSMGDTLPMGTTGLFHTLSLLYKTHTRGYHQRWQSLVPASLFFQLICNNIQIIITNGHSKSLVSAPGRHSLSFPCLFCSLFHSSILHPHLLPSFTSLQVVTGQSVVRNGALIQSQEMQWLLGMLNLVPIPITNLDLFLKLFYL